MWDELLDLADQYPNICHFYDIGDAESRHWTWTNYDHEYDVLAVEQATELARTSRRQVTLVRRGAKVGDTLGRSTRWVILQELKSLGVRTITGAEYIEINEDGLLISLEGQEELLEADTIVIAAGYEVDSELAEKWRDAAPEVYVIGDARSPRKGIDAIREGAQTARQI